VSCSIRSVCFLQVLALPWSICFESSSACHFSLESTRAPGYSNFEALHLLTPPARKVIAENLRLQAYVCRHNLLINHFFHMLFWFMMPYCRSKGTTDQITYPSVPVILLSRFAIQRPQNNSSNNQFINGCSSQYGGREVICCEERKKILPKSLLCWRLEDSSFTLCPLNFTL
jgi:hypothetical protein